MADRISMDDFVGRHGDDVTVVDVREADEYVSGHVPGAIFAPMSNITPRLAALPRDEVVYVICRSGQRSQAMADLMVAQGIRAVSIDGGTMAWINAGQPVVEGRTPR